MSHQGRRDRNCWQRVRDYFFVVCVITWLSYPGYAIRLGYCMREDRLDQKELSALKQNCIHLCSSTCFTAWRTIIILAASLIGAETHLRRMIPQDGIGALTLKREHGTRSKRLLYLTGRRVPSVKRGRFENRAPAKARPKVPIRRFLGLTSPVRLW
jgi:hypothetical protein